MYAFEEPFGPSQVTFRLSVAKQTSHLIFQGNYDSCISPKRAEGSLGNIRHTGELYIRQFRNEKESSLC